MAVSTRTISLNVFGLLLVKAVGMLVSLATIPVLLGYFKGDKAILGTWLAFFTITTIATSFDFGIGNRLKNDILSRVSLNLDYKDLIADSVVTQSLVAICIGACLLLTGFATTNSQNLGGETGQMLREHPGLLVCATALVLFTMPLKLGYFILQAQQKNALSAAIPLVPQLVILLFSGAAAVIPASLSVTTLALILLFSTAGIHAVVFFQLESVDLKQLIHRFGRSDFISFIASQIKKLQSGFSFFVIQLAIIFLYSYNEVFYLFHGSPSYIVDYQYYFRPFSLFSVGLSIISLPFWSAIRLSQLKRNTKRTKQLFLTIILLNAPIAVSLLTSAYFFQVFLDLWLGKEVHTASSSMLIVFCTSTLLVCIMHSTSSILSGFDLIGFQAKALAFGLLIKLLFLVILMRSSIKFDPVMTSTVIGLAFVVSAYSFKCAHLWRSINSNQNPNNGSI